MREFLKVLSRLMSSFARTSCKQIRGGLNQSANRFMGWLRVNSRQQKPHRHECTCLKTAFVAVAGDDANRNGVDTGADKTVHVFVAQVFNLKVSDKP